MGIEACTGASTPQLTPHTQRQDACKGLAKRLPITTCVSPGFTLRSCLAASVWHGFSHWSASGSAAPSRPRAGLQGLRTSIPVVHLQAGKSDLGPPAFDELHDLLDLQLGEVEVICQDVLTELHEDAAINAFSGKEAHHIL